MKSSKVTSKGQVTVPKEIRDFMKLKSGDSIEFTVDERGNVLVRASVVHVGQLKGILHRASRKPVSLEAMDHAILHHHGKER